jgi:hypothetical protein
MRKAMCVPSKRERGRAAPATGRVRRAALALGWGRVTQAARPYFFGGALEVRSNAQCRGEAGKANPWACAPDPGIWRFGPPAARRAYGVRGRKGDILIFLGRNWPWRYQKRGLENQNVPFLHRRGRMPLQWELSRKKERGRPSCPPCPGSPLRWDGPLFYRREPPEPMSQMRGPRPARAPFTRESALRAGPCQIGRAPPCGAAARLCQIGTSSTRNTECGTRNDDETAGRKAK